MIAGLVEPSSSPFGFDGVSVALAAMGTCIVRPGGIPPRSNNFRVGQGCTLGSLSAFQCVYAVKMDARIFDSSSEFIQTVERKSIGVRQSKWRQGKETGNQWEGQARSPRRCLVGLRSAWKHRLQARFPIHDTRIQRSLRILL